MAVHIRPTPELASDLAIEATELEKHYGKRDTGVQALDGVSLAVPTGTVFALLGPNGAGKTTTVKILTTLSRPDSGSARVAGIDLLRRPGDVRMEIGCVTQRSGTDLTATGRENLVLQGRIYGMSKRDVLARAAELLALFGLDEAADRQVRTYSGGMQRKLDVALGLVHRPQVLFLDEPTTGLDPEARAEMWTEIARLAGVEGMTVLLTTHYLDEADRLAGNLAIVEAGKIVAQGSPDELKSELRGDAVIVGIADERGARRAEEVLGGLAGLREVSREGRVVRARVDAGASVLPAVLGSLEAAGLVVSSATVSRPSLDDVYLRHAGRSLLAAQGFASHEGGGSVSTLVAHSGYLVTRSLRGLLRQPIYIAFTLVQPIIWLLLFGELFSKIVELPGFGGGSYLDYLTPGVVVMTALFASAWSGFAFIQDMERGVMDRMLTSPVSRGAMIMGSLANQAVTTAVQTVIIFGIGLAVGARFDGGLVGVLVTLVAAILLAVAFAAFSDALALLLRTQEALIGVANFLTLPLSFLSSAIMATALAPSWIQQVSMFNPVDWAATASRMALLEVDPDWAGVFARLGGLLAVAVALGWLATRAFRTYQRSA